MSAEAVRRIADAVLYEGYVLWPYRRSALKNQQRFTFGGVYPRGWHEGPSRMRTECLLECQGEPRVEVAARFLQVVERQPFDAAGRAVAELHGGGERHLAWEEATEREVVASDPGKQVAIAIAAGSEAEPLGPRGEEAGAIVRRWRELRGAVALSSRSLGAGLHRVGVTVENHAETAGEPRDQVLKRSFCSTHAVLEARGGEFVSLTDPPRRLRSAAEECVNEGAWPVLVGDRGERRTVLASPIILEDYPRVAPESPGDLFDGGEIDGLLTLNILALTDEERAEMRDSDPRARAILERTEALSEEELMRLHGTIRDLQRHR